MKTIPLQILDVDKFIDKLVQEIVLPKEEGVEYSEELAEADNFHISSLSLMDKIPRDVRYFSEDVTHAQRIVISRAYGHINAGNIDIFKGIWHSWDNYNIIFEHMNVRLLGEINFNDGSVYNGIKMKVTSKDVSGIEGSLHEYKGYKKVGLIYLPSKKVKKTIPESWFLKEA